MFPSWKSFNAAVFGVVGVLVLAGLLVALNFLVYMSNVPLDVTRGHLYSLSDGTRTILSGLQHPVTLRFYYSKDVEGVPKPFTVYAKRVEDFLKQYHEAGKGKVKLERYNPSPDTDAEDAARLDGIDGQDLGQGERFYLGVTVQAEQVICLPFLAPADEETLEYQITRAIYRATHPDKLKIGLMAGLDLTGQGAAALNSALSQRKPWRCYTELQRDYQVVDVPPTSDSIPADLKMLLIVHPKALSEKTLYAIDQYLLHGGNVLALVDPLCSFESANNPMAQFGQQGPSSSTLGPLFNAWGIGFATDKVVFDNNFATRMRKGNSLAVLTLPHDAMNEQDVTTHALELMYMVYAGAFTGTGAAGLTETVLISTTQQSQLVDAGRLPIPGGEEAAIKDFVPGDKRLPLAIKLTGTFKSAFPSGPPGGPAEPATPAAGTTPTATPAHLSEGAKPGAVILVADVDFLHDDFWIRPADAGGMPAAMLISNNFDFVQNAVEQLSGDQSLINIRTRSSAHRPFKVVQEIRRLAELKTQAERAAFKKDYDETNRRLVDLERAKGSGNGQALIYSPEQKAEIEKLRSKLATTSKSIRELEKQQKRDVNQLEKLLMWSNIALVPLIIAHFGLVLAWLRRWRVRRA